MKVLIAVAALALTLTTTAFAEFSFTLSRAFTSGQPVNSVGAFVEIPVAKWGLAYAEVKHPIDMLKPDIDSFDTAFSLDKLSSVVGVKLRLF
jgi:hypothetical protein